MYAPPKKNEASASEGNLTKKPARLFSYPPQQPSEEAHLEAVSGTVIPTQPFSDGPLLPSDRPAEHPAPHRGYLIASIALCAATGVLSLASIAIAAVAVGRASTHQVSEEGELLSVGLNILFFALSLAESCLCFIAAVTCLSILVCKPYRVLIRNPCNGSFVCLCVSFFVLFLCSIYSIVMQALVGTILDDNFALPAPACVVHCLRAVGIISFFAVLVSNSKLLPHDRLM